MAHIGVWIRKEVSIYFLLKSHIKLYPSNSQTNSMQVFLNVVVEIKRCTMCIYTEKDSFDCEGQGLIFSNSMFIKMVFLMGCISNFYINSIFLMQIQI